MLVCDEAKVAQAARKRGEAGAVADWLELPGKSQDYETNPIVRQVSREPVLPPMNADVEKF